MFKQLFLTLIILLPTFYTNAQKWFEIGTQWHYETFSFFDDFIDYNLIEVVGDTVIENTVCKFIERRQGTCNLRPKWDYMHEENGMVYYWHSDSTGFKLLYDFNNVQGESWKIDLYYMGNPPEYFDEDYVIVSVDSVRNVTYNGVSLKVLDVTYSGYEFQDILIERIGGVQGIFPFSHGLCEAISFRRCYEDIDLGLVKFMPIPCDTAYTIISTDDISQIENITLSPNPVSNELMVDMGESGYILNSIYVFSLNGRVVGQYDDINPSQPKISLSSFPQGIYIVKIVTEEAGVITRRVVKY